MPIKYNLPRKRLSWSQLSLWLKNKDQYRQRYYMDGPAFESKETIFGREMAELFEKGESHPVLDKVPRYSSMEHKIEIDVGGVPFLGYIDSFDPKTNSIIEMKTGKEPWDDVRVHKWDQLTTYSLLAKLAYGKVDPVVKLVWIETHYAPKLQKIGSRTIEAEGDELAFTGKIQVFERRIKEWERILMKKTILFVAQEISKDYTNWQLTL